MILINENNSNNNIAADEYLITNSNKPVSILSINHQRSRLDKPNNKQEKLLLGKYVKSGINRNDHFGMSESSNDFAFDDKCTKSSKLIEYDSMSNQANDKYNLIGQQKSSRIEFSSKEAEYNISTHSRTKLKYRLVTRDSRKNKLTIHRNNFSKMVKPINTSANCSNETKRHLSRFQRKVDSIFQIETPSVESSFLKRQKATTSLTLNSTEMDNKKSSIKFSSFLEGNSSLESLSEECSNSSCSSCGPPNRIDCSYCDQCNSKASTNDSTYESWINSTNFLSSTPVFISECESTKMSNQTKITFKIKKSIEKNKKILKKTSGFKLIQNYLISSKKSIESTHISNLEIEKSKRAKNIVRVSKFKETIKQKYCQQSMQNAKIFPKILEQQRTQDLGAINTVLNSNENFSNFGDFLVWYV